MAWELSGFGFDDSTLEPLIPPQEQVIVLLLDALQKLADAGQVDAACRIAKACVVLRRSDAKNERRFNALLHRLTRRLELIERNETCNSPSGLLKAVPLSGALLSVIAVGDARLLAGVPA